MNESSYIDLSYPQVGLAAALILVNGFASLVLRLELERRLLIAAVRMCVQLLLIGLVLQWIFQVQSWIVVVALMAVMTTIGGGAAAGRPAHRYAGIWWDSVVSMWASSWMVTAVALLIIFRVVPWYQPQYAIPLLGMILGNTLNGVALGLDRFGRELETHRDQIDGWLAIGATRWEAARDSIRESVRTGMIPILNAMAVAGLVSLPGMMTGQLLAGVSPVQAVKYQIVIMFLIAAGVAMGTVGVILLSYRRLFNSDHQFLAHRLVRR